MRARHSSSIGTRLSLPTAGYTLAELLVVVAICAILLSIAIPAINGVRHAASSVVCRSNLRQVGISTISYALDHRERLPADGNKGVDDPATSPAWFYRLPPYLEDSDVDRPASTFQCPSFRWDGPQVFTNASAKSYKMNAYLDNDGRPLHYRRGSLRGEERNIVLFFDAVAGETGMGQWGHGFASAVDGSRHGGRVNLLMLDCRTVTMDRGDDGTDWRTHLKWTSDKW